jgi:zinc protease
MTLRLRAILAAAAALVLAARPTATPAQTPVAAAAAPLEAQVPLDPQVVHDTLANGLLLYVRANPEPRDRAELRLVLKAGSVLEDEDQRGLAHLVEHMAFNGTARFEKQALVDYLESIGMRFGPDVNAYTAFDETVYMLTVPTDSAAQFETALRILEDWARHLAFEPAEVEKERPVVIEEWRLGRGAGMRTLDAHLPVLFHGSRYAERLPIGRREVIETAPVEALRRFYDTWYRPDLAAVIAVGDFDAERVAAQLRERFAGWEGPTEPRPRASFPVPSHEETLVSVATDPETTVPSVSVYHKHAPRETGTLAAYRRSIVEALRSAILSRRYFELSQRPEPPFLGAATGGGRFVESADVVIYGAGLKETDVAGGIDALVTEAERAERHGFTPTELEREKKEILRAVEGAYDEREKTHSARYAQEFLQHFLHGFPAPGPAIALELHRRFLPEIALAEVDAATRAAFGEESRVVLLTAPEKAGVEVPSAESVLAAFQRAAQSEVAAYEDRSPAGPLVATPPAPGRIVAERAIPEIGVTIWELSNGAEVVLKATDFKDDEVLFHGASPGGSSLAPDSLVVPASTATWVVEQSGLGELDLVALHKALAGVQVAVSPFIGSLEEGLSGRASPRDLETLFQLVHLYVTAPREDPDAFASLRERMRGQLANRSASPEAAFRDTLSVTIADHHPRAVATTPAPSMVDRMDLEASLAFYRDRFADVDDFDFYLVGAFDPDSVRPMVERWLATLPALPREETWRDDGIDPPATKVERVVRKGIEPKSQTTIVFPGSFEWSLDNVNAIGALGDYLEIRLREELREDLGGTYAVSVAAAGWRWPDPQSELRVSFGADPPRVDELLAIVFGEIGKVWKGEVDAEDFAKVKEAKRREHETNLRENAFWLARLDGYRRHGVDPREVLNIDERIEALAPGAVAAAARRWVDPDRYVRVTLLPE